MAIRLDLDHLDPLHDAVLTWYDAERRDLPWRSPGTSPWQVLVSEVMLQQTPVARVLEPYARWIERWPTPAALAAEPAGEAVRAWGRLGYPRRALRLHACAVALTEVYDGVLPEDVDELRALPGIGEYTAAAVAVFAYGRRHAVLDTNVRRVLSRLVDGEPYPPSTLTVAERRRARALLPDAPARSARWSIGLMEIGALVCRAQTPRCDACPVRTWCRWEGAGRPAYDGPPRRGQSYAGTDRQCRGRLLAVLRSSAAAVPGAVLRGAWDDDTQRERALDSLLDDGLVVITADGKYALPA
ncbi:A/G-specific adenine glycosylase [Mumia flava]|uniref:Adenine DNA glycosylase n=1 Tax=Mumia flava TaxID=1348852 RepID=A0A0B2BQM8_9ACTN|nr:A/G-specific adenine glycosylase [Mumia flava]PJJ58150.1 A/G-specific adenine glycosylase [Mumia flava]